MPSPPPRQPVRGWLAGNSKDYDRAYALDVPQLFRFLQTTQPETFSKLAWLITRMARTSTAISSSPGSPTRLASAASLTCCARALTRPAHFDMFYGTPSPGNAKATALHDQNRLHVTRQLRYSTDEDAPGADLCLFINGLPISTFELKNSLTKQTVEDAIEQYRRDRDPREKLFEFARCVVHFAVDDAEVRMCTECAQSFHGFCRSIRLKDGAGNHPTRRAQNRLSLKEVLTPGGLNQHPRKLRPDRKRKRTRRRAGRTKQVFPRFHQLDVCTRFWLTSPSTVRAAVSHTALGWQRKSNSIAWLAHQLIALKKDEKEIFDSVIVVTDRGSSMIRFKRP